ncbi:MAG: oxidoreductase [Burkholderiales bacterium]|nr:oxidoreductase [Burkholderiales bacterium]
MRQSTEWAPARVHHVADLSPTVREITLRPEHGTPAWQPGSHLRVQVRLPAAEAGAPERLDTRHYSLVNMPGEGLWRIAVKRTEPSRGGSRFMAALQVGDVLLVQGPDNHFALPAGPAPTLLVAGGIGITPLLGMARALAERGEPPRLLYAARTAAEFVYADELRALLGDRLVTHASDQRQRIDLAREITQLPPHAQLLVCGPLPLMQAAQQAWAAAGRPPEALRFETFGASGERPAQAFRVKLPRHRLELDVPPQLSLLQVLQDHGVEVLSDCRRGECGLCALDVLAVEAGQIDHRDVFFDAEQRRAGRQLCACVSRVAGEGATVVIDSAWRPDTLAA